MKTKKSLTKRIRITKNGKLKARKPGFNHFNAKQKRRKQLQGKTAIDFTLSNKDRGRYFPHLNIKVRKPRVNKEAPAKANADNK
jgi:ribosomal protein L35